VGAVVAVAAADVDLRFRLFSEVNPSLFDVLLLLLTIGFSTGRGRGGRGGGGGADGLEEEGKGANETLGVAEKETEFG